MESSPRQPRIVICCLREDRSAGIAIAEELRQRKAEPWLIGGPSDLGEAWQQICSEAIRDADGFVVCLRPGFDAAGMAQEEVRHSMLLVEEEVARGKELFPYILEPVQGDQPSIAESLERPVAQARLAMWERQLKRAPITTPAPTISKRQAPFRSKFGNWRPWALGTAGLVLILLAYAVLGPGLRPAPPNRAPEADAGPDRVVETGQIVRLAAAGNDPEGAELAYTWEQTSGPPVRISNPLSNPIVFEAPAAGSEIEFRLRAFDGEITAEDTVRVEVVSGPEASVPSAPQVLWMGTPRFSKSANRPLALVIHAAQGSTESLSERMQAATAETSVHYLVTQTGVVLQFVREADAAFHLGSITQSSWAGFQPGKDPNLYTIGIQHELGPDGSWSPEMIRSSAELIKDICSRWKIPLDREHVIGHREISSLGDPRHPDGASGIINCPGAAADLFQLVTTAEAESPRVPEPSGFVARVGQVEILVTVRIREKAANTSAAVVRTATAGSVLRFVGWITNGQSLRGNSIWYRDVNGDYFWAGATRVPRPDQAPAVSEVNRD